MAIRKIKKLEYESLAECIASDQVPPADIAYYFKDKKFYKYYKENYMWIYERPQVL